MGLILDTSILIASERRNENVARVLEQLEESFGKTEVAILAISVIEFTQGIYRVRPRHSNVSARPLPTRSAVISWWNL